MDGRIIVYKRGLPCSWYWYVCLFFHKIYEICNVVFWQILWKLKVALHAGEARNKYCYQILRFVRKHFINVTLHGIKRRSSSFNTSRIDKLYQDTHQQNQNYRQVSKPKCSNVPTLNKPYPKRLEGLSPMSSHDEHI